MHAKSCHEAWWFLFDSNPNRSQILNITKKYYSFFETVRPALYTTFVVKLASIFDEDSKSISLKALVEEIEMKTNIIFRSKSIDFDDLWKRGRRLYKYRNKVIAHRDKEVLTRNFAKETGFEYNDLKAILDDSCIFLDEVLHFTGRKKFNRLPSASELEKLIRDLSYNAQHPAAKNGA